MYPDLLKIGESDFEDVSFGLYSVCKNLIGTESTSASGVGFGGAHSEIRNAVAAAMRIAIEFEEDEVRHFNSATIDALFEAWVRNDHEAFLARCAGYERNATNSKIDLLPLAQEVSESVYEILDDEDEVVDEIDPVVAEYASIMGESTSVKRFITGNRHKRKPGKKPPSRIQKILDFSGVEK
jgi:hypothetical protein